MFAGECAVTSLHITVEAGGLCTGVRHGVHYAVRCPPDARYL